MKPGLGTMGLRVANVGFPSLADTVYGEFADGTITADVCSVVVFLVELSPDIRDATLRLLEKSILPALETYGLPSSNRARWVRAGA